MKRKKCCQKEFRKQTFDFYQYWMVYFTEKIELEDGSFSDKDYVTCIKAKSYDLSKLILKKKIEEDFINSRSSSPESLSVLERKKLRRLIKLKAVRPYMFHKNYRGTKLSSLSSEDWDNIKSSSFPNLRNFLFKKELPRPEGYNNKYNKTDYTHLKTIGFKSGEENWAKIHRKGVYLSIDERRGMIYKGKWVKWDSEEIKKTKNQIIEALTLNDHNRKKSAEYLGIGRNCLYKMMTRIESLEWWNENYPMSRPIPPRVPTEIRSKVQRSVMKKRMDNGEVPFGNLTEEQKKKCRDRRIESLKASSRKYRESLVPVIIEALKNNSNVRVDAAKSLNVKPTTFQKWLRMTKDQVNWQLDYPSPNRK